MTDRTSVGANSVVANSLSGKVHEFLPFNAMVRLLGTASAVGLNMTLLIGGRSVLQDQEVNAQNRMPLTPDDVLVAEVGRAGERLVLSYRNTTGAAITAFASVEVIPL